MPSWLRRLSRRDTQFAARSLLFLAGRDHLHVRDAQRHGRAAKRIRGCERIDAAGRSMVSISWGDFPACGRGVLSRWRRTFVVLRDPRAEQRRRPPLEGDRQRCRPEGFTPGLWTQPLWERRNFSLRHSTRGPDHTKQAKAVIRVNCSGWPESPNAPGHHSRLNSAE